MFDQVVTIFNYMNEGNINYSWKKTVIHGVTWREKQTRTVNGARTVIDTVVEITIPYREGYVEPRKFDNDPSVWSGDSWTLNPYSGKDFVLLGEFEGTLESSTNLTQFKQNNVVGVIATVKNNTHFPQLKHWKIELSK